MIVRETLSDQIYFELRKAILSREIPLGSKIVNRQLQERFNVSSSPIRDAVNRLYQDELISKVTNAGASVIELEYQTASEINEIIKYIVMTGVEISFKKGNRDSIVRDLKELIKLQEKEIDNELYYNYDYDFHKTFIDNSNNRYLKKLYKQYHALNELLVRSFHSDLRKDLRKSSFETHIKIVEAYEKGQLDTALSLTKGHYDIADDMFRLVFEEKENAIIAIDE